MNFFAFSRGVVSVCLLLVVTTAGANVSQWTPTLVADSEVLSSGSETLRIRLPDDMPPASLEWLALELDGIDVSEIVQLEQDGETLVVAVTPVQPLAAGAHELRLVEYTPDGDIIERGVWRLMVEGGAPTPRDAVRFFAANFVLEGSYRIAEAEDVDLFSDKVQGQGAATIQASSSDGQRESEVLANFLYDSNGSLAGTVDAADPIPGADPRTGRDFELGEYRLSTASRNVSAILGHHAPANSGLLIQDFHRRGVSVTAQTDSGSLVGSGFAYRTEPVSGFRYGAGIGDVEHRVAGSMLSISPLAAGKDPLTITATWIDGEGQDHSGLGVAGNNVQPRGDGLSLALESHLANRRLRLRAEHAETRYDLDGRGSDFERDEDDAQSFLGLFHIWRGKAVGDRQANWNVGYEQKEIGLFFRSLANPSLPFDRSLKRVFSVMQVGGLSMQLQLAREQDNVRNDPILPTLSNELATFALAWSPIPDLDENGDLVRRWYGQPTLSFSAQYSDQLHENLPVLLADSGVDRQTSTYQGGISFQYDTLFWGINHSYGLEKDFGLFGSRNRHELSDITVQWQAGQSLLVGAQVQYNSILDRLDGRVGRSWLAGFDARFSSFDDRLSTTLNFNVNQDGASDDSIDSETRTVGLRFDWALRQASANRPGWTLWLQGERQQFEDRLNPEFDQSPYQVLLGARMDWPVSASGY
jgi:hypothetical protein